MSELKLSTVYEDEAVQAFGRALNINLRNDKDYASLAEFEQCEKPTQFGEVLKRFLRRYEVGAAKRERDGRPVFRPSDVQVRRIMQLVDEVGVEPVRSALVAYSLVWHERPAKQPAEGGQTDAADI